MPFLFIAQISVLKSGDFRVYRSINADMNPSVDSSNRGVRRSESSYIFFFYKFTLSKEKTPIIFLIVSKDSFSFVTKIN